MVGNFIGISTFFFFLPYSSQYTPIGRELINKLHYFVITDHHYTDGANQQSSNCQHHSSYFRNGSEGRRSELYVEHTRTSVDDQVAYNQKGMVR